VVLFKTEVELYLDAGALNTQHCISFASSHLQGFTRDHPVEESTEEAKEEAKEAGAQRRDFIAEWLTPNED